MAKVLTAQGKTTATQRGTSKKKSAHLQLGALGEEFAARYLCDLGLIVLSRNWRCRQGELDVVATDGRQLIVCEVKTRSSGDFGAPAEAVTREKSMRIRRLASEWLRTFRVGWCSVRFDVLSVYAPDGQPLRVHHIRGAF